MVELLANGSVAVMPSSITETTERPSGVKGRLLEFVSKFSGEFTSLRGSDLDELTRNAEAAAFARRHELSEYVPYDAGTAAIKIVNRWKSQDVDGNYTIRHPDFAYCS